MENKASIVFLSLFIVLICSCDIDYKHFYGREIVILNNNSLFCYNDSSKNLHPPLKIFLYSDNEGCISCRLKLHKWNDFLTTIDSISHGNVNSLFYLYSTHKHINSLIQSEKFFHPICVDELDSVNIINQFPQDDRFRCFLLDSTNRVILIGNPVQNPKIKELYLRTICDRLGIEYNQNSDAKKDNKNEINLGSFPKSESKSVQFFIPNNTESEMQIDTVFSSCECTTAKIDKISISPHQNASLSVTYTPDGSGEFFREVYVKVRGEDKPKTFAIRGNVE